MRHTPQHTFKNMVSLLLADKKQTEGWTVAKYLLEFERGAIAYTPTLKAGLENILEIASREISGMGEPLLFTWGQVRFKEPSSPSRYCNFNITDLCYCVTHKLDLLRCTYNLGSFALNHLMFNTNKKIVSYNNYTAVI